MTAAPPTGRIPRVTRLLAAVVIALVALGITWLAERWLPGKVGTAATPERVE